MKVVFDRFEGDLAIIEFGEVTVNVPRRELPAGTAEGSVLTVRFELDPAGTEERRKRVEDTIRRLRELSES
ncbi:MAG: DUF3006 domain-containing protein [Bacillota bacterium]